MVRRVVKTKPGVLVGITTNKLYKGRKAYFYDGDEHILTIELDKAYRAPRTVIGYRPAYELDEPVFFKVNITLSCEKDIDIDPFFS